MYLTIIKDGFKIKVYHNVLMVVDTLKNVKVASATYCLVDCVSYLLNIADPEIPQSAGLYQDVLCRTMISIFFIIYISILSIFNQLEKLEAVKAP